MPTSAAVQPETAQSLSNTLVRVMKIMSAMKHQAPRQHAAVDPSHYPLLFCLSGAPQRVSGVAESIHSDVSTVSNLLTLEINSSGPAYPDNASVFVYHDRARDAVSRLAGVKSVSVASQIPLSGNIDRFGVHPVDRLGAGNPELDPSGDMYAVSLEYLRTMNIPITRGRAFEPREMTDTLNRVVILSDAMANVLWPGQDPLGKSVRLGGVDSPNRRVIGTVGNVHHSGLDVGMVQQVYVPEQQFQFAYSQAILVVRTERDPETLASSIRRAIHEIDPTQPIVRVATMDQLIATSTSQRRLALVLFTAFGGTALLLAVIGIYGVLAGRVAERTREIGLRSALGATPADILRLVVGQGLKLAALGLILGMAAAMGLSSFLEALLFGITPNDPVTLAGVAALLGGVTVVACVVPARRALGVDPTEALRSE